MRSSTAALPESRSIVIEGELVRVTKTIVEKQVRTSDLLQEIANTQPLSTGLLPRGCIAFSRKTDSQGANTLYVMERPAGMVAIRYKNGGSHDEQSEENISQLMLSWPRTQWFVRWIGTAISELYITCTKEPVRGLDDPIFVLPMPNIYDDGHGGVCLGNLVVPDTCGPAERTEHLIETVLSSLWNKDLLPDFEPLGLKGLEDWAERSGADPQLGLKLEYRSHKKETLGKLMDAILGE